MPIRVLVVDDSSFYRARIEAVLRADSATEVVGAAANGLEAVTLVQQLSPDVVTMDYDMPAMDGIKAIEEILRLKPIPILMLSAMTVEGAQTTLKALEAGAADFMPKNADSLRPVNGSCQLVEKIKEISQYRVNSLRPASRAVSGKVLPARAATTDRAVVRPESNDRSSAGVSSTRRLANTKLKKGTQLIVIGASTGGPVAVQQVLTALPEHFPVPILLVIHMPSSFMQAYAERLNQRCKLQVLLAESKTPIKPGCVYVAKGGLQTIVEDKRGTLNVVAGDAADLYRPCVDKAFESAAKHLGDAVLGIVLTGMGSDGQRGAVALKRAGASVWVQDSESCVIYGMPQAVVSAGAADAQVELARMGTRLDEEIQRALR